MYTITSQGSFVSDGLSKLITVPQGIDWFKVVNYTTSAAYTANTTQEWNWYRGMAVNDSLNQTNIAAHFTANRAALVALGGNYVGVNGFTLIDTTTQVPSVAVATTASTAAANPVVSTANTASLNINQTVIRLSNVATCPSYCGIDYTVPTIVANTSFTLPTHATAFPAGGAGFYRIISYSPSPEFYPVNRTVINITQAVNPVVTVSVKHNYTYGQVIRMKVPAVCGMIQMNDVEGVITAVTDYTFTLANTENFSVDSTGFTAFQWPMIAVYPYQVAQAIPVGEACAVPYSQLYLDATVNLGLRGMILNAGTPALAESIANSPAGTSGDVMYWQAGKVVNL